MLNIDKYGRLTDLTRSRVVDDEMSNYWRSWLVGIALLVSVTTALWITAQARHSDWLKVLEVASWVATIAMALSALLAIVLRWAKRREAVAGASMEEEAQRRVVRRPAESETAIRTLLRRRSGRQRLAVTAALHGAGGFGKTTLARQILKDRRIRRRFRGGVYEVALGQDAVGSDLAKQINDVSERISGVRPGFTKAQQAGQHLAQLLASGPPRVLLVDDVWTSSQIVPFLYDTGRSALVLTTRNVAVIPAMFPRVEVDQVTDEQARRILSDDVPAMPGRILRALIDATGRWPLLLALVNGEIRDSITHGEDAAEVGARILTRLLAAGPASLDIQVPGQRQFAVSEAIEGSLSRVPPRHRERVLELSVFAEDTQIPLSIVIAMWAMAGIADEDARHLIRTLASVSIVRRVGPDHVSMHDVVRAYLRSRLTGDETRAVNGSLLQIVANRLPRLEGNQTAWWELDRMEQYLWRYLPYHMAEAGRTHERDALVVNLHWVVNKLRILGPASVVSDLAGAALTERARSLARTIEEAPHLLAETEPEDAVVNILLSRIEGHVEWRDEVDTLRSAATFPQLRSQWTLVEDGSPAIRRALGDHSGAVHAVAFSPNGRWLASGGADGTVRVWDAGTGRPTLVMAEHSGAVYAVAFSPDGRWLASGGADKTVRVWDIERDQPGRILVCRFGRVRAIAFSPDGQWLAASSGCLVIVWRVADAEYRKHKVLIGHMGPVQALAFSHNSQRLATVWGRVRVWDIGRGKACLTLTGFRNMVFGVAYSPDGLAIAASNWGGKVRVWDTTTGQGRTLTDKPECWIKSVAYSPDGRFLAYATIDRTVWVVDSRTGQLAGTLAGHTDHVMAVAYDPRGRRLASAGRDGLVRIWETSVLQRSGQALHIGKLQAVALSDNGLHLVSASDDSGMCLWDAASGRRVALLRGHRGDIRALAFSPDGQWLASAGYDMSLPVALWDVRSGHIIHELVDTTGIVSDVAFSPDGRLLAIACTMMRIWNIRSGEIWGTRERYIGATSVEFSPNGHLLASASHISKEVRLWDPESGRLVRTLKGHKRPVYGVSFSPDGKLLASASRDRSVRIWQVTTGETVYVLSGHSEAVKAVSFSGDGRWLYSAGYDRTMRVWDTKDWSLSTLMRIDDALESIAVAADNSLVAVAGGTSLWVYRHLPPRSVMEASGRPPGPGRSDSGL